MELILFTSFDLVNSTEYKSLNSNWPEIIHIFYSNISAEVVDLNKHWGINIEYFKLIGDEYVTKLVITSDNFKLLPTIIKGIYQLLVKVNDGKEAVNKKLGLKGTCWLALIDDVNNIKTRYFGNEDYLGTQIDEGFRLTKHSYKKMLALSPELTYIIFSKFEDQIIWQNNVRLFGYAILKGIWNNRYYPIILYCENILSEAPYDFNYNKVVEFLDANYIDNKRVNSNKSNIGERLRKALQEVDILNISPIYNYILTQFNISILQ